MKFIFMIGKDGLEVRKLPQECQVQLDEHEMRYMS